VAAPQIRPEFRAATVDGTNFCCECRAETADLGPASRAESRARQARFPRRRQSASASAKGWKSGRSSRDSKRKFVIAVLNRVKGFSAAPNPGSCLLLIFRRWGALLDKDGASAKLIGSHV